MKGRKARMLPCLRSSSDGVYLQVKLQPKASRNEIGPATGPELKVRVTAPPVDSAANEALLRLLADHLECSRNCLQLVRGQTSRHKTILLRSLTPAWIEQRLGPPASNCG